MHGANVLIVCSATSPIVSATRGKIMVLYKSRATHFSEASYGTGFAIFALHLNLVSTPMLTCRTFPSRISTRAIIRQFCVQKVATSTKRTCPFLLSDTRLNDLMRLGDRDWGGNFSCVHVSTALRHRRIG